VARQAAAAAGHAGTQTLNCMAWVVWLCGCFAVVCLGPVTGQAAVVAAAHFAWRFLCMMLLKSDIEDPEL
jgi:hypothetical protein